MSASDDRPLTAGAADELRRHKAELLSRLRPAGEEAGRMAFGTQVASSASDLARRIPSAGNVVGIGFGAKTTAGQITSDVALRVYVKTKHARRSLRHDELVPDEINGLATDVLAVGDVVALVRPVRGGASVGHREVTAGTLGCLVHRGEDERAAILSNNHVLANVNRAELGDDILQPGPADGGRSPIATLSDFEPIVLSGTPNTIDAAVADVLDPDDVEPGIETIGGITNPPGEAALYESVRKHGRTTEHTVGVVMDLSADLWVRVGPQEQAWFEDQLAVVGAGGPFSQPGDSGSLVVDAVSRSALGLLFAGGRDHTFVNRIQPVLERFSATIVEGTTSG